MRFCGSQKTRLRCLGFHGGAQDRIACLLPGMDTGNYSAGRCFVSVTLDPQQWAEEQFGDCQLGDARRTQRAVTLAAQVAAHPSGTTPQQTSGWNGCKAAYRLFDADDVTFETLAECHWRRTLAHASGHCLAIGDTTELEFGIHRKVEGLGPT